MGIPVPGREGRPAGPQGFLPEQRSPSSVEQIIDIPAPGRGVQRGLQGFSQERSSTACTMEQNVDIPVPGGSLHGLSVSGSSSSSAVSRGVRGEGVFRTFPLVEKSATLPPRSGSALPPHSRPWTPAAYDVSMALEEEPEEELDDDVEKMEFDGCWWCASGSRLASSIAGGWPRQTDPRLAIRSGGPRGSSGVDQGGRLTDSGWCLCRDATETDTHSFFFGRSCCHARCCE